MLNKIEMVEEMSSMEFNFNNICAYFKNKLDNKIVAYIGELTNLKLYDVFSYVMDEFDSEDKAMEIFDRFAEDMYEDFKLFEDDICIQRYYLGRTSSFFIDDCDTEIIDYYYANEYREEKDIEKKKEMLIDEFIYTWINADEDIIEEEYNKGDIKILVDSFISFTEALNNIYKGYKYIEEFKENQVEIFKQWYEKSTEK